MLQHLFECATHLSWQEPARQRGSNRWLTNKQITKSVAAKCLMRRRSRVKNIHIVAGVLLAAVATKAPAQDWSGAYIGASVGTYEGTGADYNEGVLFEGEYDNPFDRNGNMTSLFAGYRWQNENIVFGPEIAYSSGSLEMESNPNNEITDTQAIQMKVGYAADRLLLSAGFGFVRSTVSPACVDTCGVAEMNGTSLSLGADYMLNEQAFVGVALSRRSYERATYEILEGWEVDGDDTAIELRIGYNF